MVVDARHEEDLLPAVEHEVAAGLLDPGEVQEVGLLAEHVIHVEIAGDGLAALEVDDALPGELLGEGLAQRAVVVHGRIIAETGPCAMRRKRLL
jgi:hypothetical protein